MAMKLLTKNTHTGASTSQFLTKIDNTYRLYQFHFIQLNPSTDGADFQFQGNASGETGFNEYMTSTFWRSVHQEDDGQATHGYDDNWDSSNATGYTMLAPEIGSGADESGSGVLHLFNPSSTAHKTMWYARFPIYESSNDIRDYFTGGFFDATAAITQLEFKFDTGTFDGEIRMYGVG